MTNVYSMTLVLDYSIFYGKFLIFDIDFLEDLFPHVLLQICGILNLVLFLLWKWRKLEHDLSIDVYK